MHMSDALLTPLVGGVMAAASAGAIAVAVKKTKENGLEDRKIPMMGVLGAFVFAGQMINFTIPGTGSSGHIGGGILLAALLGPYPALLTMTAILLIQCLLFADGGLLALGCNIFNMGVLACMAGYPLYRAILKRGISNRNIMIASVASVIVGLQLGAFAVVLETAASGVAALPIGPFAALMQPIHLAIGLVEGIVTGAVLCFVRAARPDMLDISPGAGAALRLGSRKAVAAFAAAAVILAGGVSLLASSNPDGLEWAIERAAGGAEITGESAVHDAASSVQETTAVMPDYSLAGSPAGVSAAGIAGSAATLAFAAGSGFAIAAVRKRRERAPKDA